MQRIKFRAWDRMGDEMIGPNEFFQLADGDSKGCRLSDFFAVDDKGKVGREHEQIVFMQFTGLKDRNGKEIYEGDIVKRSFGRVHDIVWHEATASFRIGRYAITEMIFQKMEVVGNIYENPELLKIN